MKIVSLKNWCYMVHDLACVIAGGAAVFSHLSTSQYGKNLFQNHFYLLAHTSVICGKHVNSQYLLLLPLK